MHNNKIGWFSPAQSEELVGTNFPNYIENNRAKRKYQELFFDEAQDLTPAVFSNAFILAQCISCGADNAQDLQSNFPPDEAAEIIYNSLFSQSQVRAQYLEQNFRNTKEIFELARQFVPNNDNVQEIDTSNMLNG